VKREKILLYTTVASIVLHLFLAAGAVIAIRLGFFDREIKVTEKDDEPIVFEIVPPEPDRPRGPVIETPDDAKTVENPEQADYLSDKNALARNAERAPDDLEFGAPFARGDIDFPEMPTNPGADVGAQPQQVQTPNEFEEIHDSERERSEATGDISTSGDYYADAQNRDFREYLTSPGRSGRTGGADEVPRARYNNQQTQAHDVGGISFNTYNWEYAPYMLALKKKIERNIFPPPAYTRMGLISGDTLLRFRIYPDGTMKQLQVIKTKGHETLKETSVQAVSVSAPFPSLPADFPEPFLEVTARFSYFVPNRN
jgi:protein TonB